MLTSSHLVSVPPGPHLLSDIIQQSPILFDPEQPGASGGGDTGGGVDDFETSDPELAMALRMSLQEAQEREARERGDASAPAPAAAAPASGSGSGATGASSAVDVGALAKDVPTPAHPEAGHRSGFIDAETEPLLNANDHSLSAPGDDDDDEYMDDDEEAMLARAMALSRGDNPDEHDILMAEDDDEEDEEAAIARAIAMSLQGNEKSDKEKK
jgi:26S proteasome regulatory subunit N10